MPPPLLLNAVPYEDAGPWTLQPTPVALWREQLVLPLLLVPVWVSAGGLNEHAPAV